MSTPSTQVTAAEISRLAGVTRATVSNWRRRHEDFPAPTGGSDTSPLYDLKAVRDWLAGRGYSASISAMEELRTLLRRPDVARGSAARLIPFVLVAAEATPEQRKMWAGSADSDLVRQARPSVARALAEVPPESGNGASAANTEVDAELLRAVLACVDEEAAGGATGSGTLDVLAQRELDDNPSSSSYYTPKPVADLVVSLLTDARSGSFPQEVLDPACGSGAFLVAAAEAGARMLYGQDVAAVQAQRTAVRLRIAAPDTRSTVHAGDSLRADAFEGLTVSGVACNPPFGVRDWGQDELAYDPRWAYGVPSRSDSELAWAQHALAHVAPGGPVVMVMPSGTAFSPSGRRVRAELVRTGALRAVAALPQGAVTYTNVQLQLWVLQRPDSAATAPQSVLFMDSAVDADASGESAVDWPRLTGQVTEFWRAFATNPETFDGVPGRARAVSVIDLLDDRVDLTPARHLSVTATADPRVTAGAATSLRSQLADQAGELLEVLESLGDLDAAGVAPREWRTATVADLGRGEALSVFSAPASRRGGTSVGGKGMAARTALDQTVPGADGPAYSDLLMLRAGDVASGARAAAPVLAEDAERSVRIAAGDVLIAEHLHGRTGAKPVPFRVADEEDAGAVLGPSLRLFRPDPTRLDPWFLGGVLSAAANVGSAATGSTIVRIDVRRLRVPLLPLDEQRRYGAAFHSLHELRAAAHRTAELAARTSDFVNESLASGALLPQHSEDDATTNSPGGTHAADAAG
ncbi:N-6 DNA methylase [Streptomyces sp. NPDC127172]|uniref:N-6 DNA methylase n=1 Tax=Streptomyces sp. NPDC127172 TaxID=3345382 RepID=UPI003635F42E